MAEKELVVELLSVAGSEPPPQAVRIRAVVSVMIDVVNLYIVYSLYLNVSK
jgi:hypothetical protein